MKLTRNYALEAYRRLGAMALGHLDDVTLETTLNNFNALRKIADDFEALKKELFKRIYGDVEQMSEDERNDLQKFFDMLGKVQDGESEKAIKAAYPAYYDMRVKELKVLVSLLNKEVDTDVEPMDADAFCKGIVKGQKDIQMAEIRAFFAPIFKENEKKDADLSELDELLNP